MAEIGKAAGLAAAALSGESERGSKVQAVRRLKRCCAIVVAGCSGSVNEQPQDAGEVPAPDVAGQQIVEASVQESTASEAGYVLPPAIAACLSGCSAVGAVSPPDASAAAPCAGFVDSTSIYAADAGFCLVTPYGGFRCPAPFVQCGDGGVTWTGP